MKPNILFILSDQHRFCDVGHAGNADLHTPVLDRLAAGGARFDHAYSTCPVCVPVRGTLLTGLHPLRHGAAGNDMPVRTDVQSVADVLNDAGYETAYIGKWHLGGIPREQFITEDRRLGFRYWRANNCNHDYMNYFYDDNDNVRHFVPGYEPVVQTDLALEYLDSRKDSGRPWAMYVCYSTPHSPYLCMPEEMQRHALGREVHLRGNVAPYSERDYEMPPDHHAFNAPGPGWNPSYDGVDALRPMYAGYHEHIEALDAQIGRLIDRLEEDGSLSDTIVVYLSDHGDMIGSHGMADKQIYYEESAHVPLIISWKDHISPGPRSQLIGIADMSPTVLGLAGLSMTGAEGQDLSRCVMDAQAEGPEYLYFHNIVPAHNAWHRENGSWRAVTDGQYVYAAGEAGQPLALYDLDADPLQMNNLRDSGHPQQVRLAQALQGFVERQDGYLPWQKLLVANGLADAWDESQLHFGFPPIAERFRT